MAGDLFDQFRVIDVDTHLTEPPDVWTSRVSKKWGDRVPHIVHNNGRDIWIVNGRPAGAPGAYTMAGFDGTLPEHRATLESCPASSYDARARLEHMDREGIHAQVLYPNVGGFGAAGFLALEDPELKLECVRAYNDFLVDWTSVAPDRLLGVISTPFWDVAAMVSEIQRCAELGLRAVLFPNEPQTHGEPPIGSRHWDPVWTAAREAGLPISFHIGGGDLSVLFDDAAGMGVKTNLARASALLFIENSQCLAQLIFGGVCHRFPELRFVSVESGVGWMGGALEAFDWQWRNSDIIREHPEYDLLPSEYFRRQIYGCFWFEDQGVKKALELYPDNILYETDFPHPTCMSPGPRSPAERPRVYATRVLSGLPEKTLQKVFHDNAALVYGLD